MSFLLGHTVPHEFILCPSKSSKKSPTCLVRLLCVNMGYFYGDSKTDLKLWCDSCTILQLCRGAQVVFSKFAGVCVANYCPTTPTECCCCTRARQWDLLYL